jgi:Bacterial mobilisation protein (MobC)
VARKRRPPPLSIRLPDDERDTLKARAKEAGLSVSGYFRLVAFNTPRRSRNPAADQELLARILVALGQSRISANINQLAHQAHLGSWPDSRLIEQGCDDIRIIRDTLLSALGRTPPPAPSGP